MTEENDRLFVEWLLKNIVYAYNYKKECIPIGCVPPTSVAILGCVWQTPPGQTPPHRNPLGRHPTPSPWADTPWADFAPGQIPPPGQYTPTQLHVGILTPAHCMLGYTPWTEEMTHACENITFPQLLLRAVKRPFVSFVIV